jgi:hypothetical protein
MRLVLSAVAVASLCASPVWAQSDKSKNTETHDTRPEPPMLGKHLAKGQARPGGGGQSPLLTYHGGNVVLAPTSVDVHPIFWGNSWQSVADEKIDGMKLFYGGVGGSPYLNSNTEYTHSSNGSGAHVTTAVTVVTPVIDHAAAPKSGSQTSPILAEVCKMISNPSSTAYYPVYVDTKRGHAGFCAWHSWGTCGGVNVQFGFFFNLDGDAGCDPGDNTNGHSQGLAAIANVSGHELSEMLTDPRGQGWFDASGAENSDKCAWTFGDPTLTFKNDTVWKVQGNWSNKAYNLTTGYTYNNKVVRGCIDGENPPNLP